MIDKRFCLRCGKEIDEGLWHKRCIKDFFGNEELPTIKLNIDELEKIAIKQINNQKGIAGVQEKLSLHLDLSNKKRPRLTVVGFPSGYILKPQSGEYKRLPEFEHTAMLLAELCNIPVVKHGLIPVNDNELAYITKRIDRNNDEKIHMVDFCQASNNVTMNKYRSSYEDCVELIMKNSKDPIIDKIRFFECLYFCFVIGNSDVHLKNFSFIMDEEGKLSLAPFYDLLPTKVILPTDHEDLGMLLNGKKHYLIKRDFDSFCEKVDIPLLTQQKIMKQIDDKYLDMCQVIDESLLDQNSKSSWKRMIKSNINRSKK